MRRALLPAGLVAALLLLGVAAWTLQGEGPGESSDPLPGGSSGPGPLEGLDERVPFRAPPPEPVRFLAWGDAGYGDEAQHALGDAAARVCEAEGCGFALLVGDNVYPHGVRNETDAQFEEKFERPYADLGLSFYSVLGNHDVGLGGTGGAHRDNGDFMVRYGQRDEDAPRWTMPARHYAFREGDVQFVVLDLTALARDGADPAQEAEQLAWLDTVWDPTARWHVAVSHFPYVSNGRHGDAGRYDGVEGRGAALAHVIEEKVCPHADLYLTGHDHDLEWLKPVPACGRTEFIVSGAAADPRPLRADGNASAWFSVGDVPGFFWFETQGDRLTGRAYGIDGKVLFERTMTKD